jgi:hypothetical protein
LAERAAASGLNNGGAGSGAFDSAIQSQIESQGIDVANYQARLMTQEISARRQDVLNALQFAQGQEKLYLEQYLQMLNSALQKYGMDQQNQQFYDDYAYRLGRDQRDDDWRMLQYVQ